jgi:hypothetical protein
VRCTICRKEDLQVFTGRFAVAEMKLYRLAFFHNVTDRNGSGLLIRAHEVSHKKVSALEPVSVLINDDAEM